MFMLIIRDERHAIFEHAGSICKIVLLKSLCL